MADPDLQMGGGGGGGGGLRKKLFRPFGPHFRLNIRGGPGPPGRPLDPPLLKKGAKVFFNCSLEYKGAFHLSELAGRPIAGPVMLTMKLGSRI